MADTWQDQLANGPDATSPVIGIVEGPAFVLAPRHRLFAVFSEPAQALEAIRVLAREGIANTDVWVYVGERGAQAIEPTIARHGPGVAIVRVAQRLLTSDCEYCLLLSKSVHEHGMVIAIEIEPESVEVARSLLLDLGGHSLGYGDHWTFVSVDPPSDGAHDLDEETAN